MQTGIAQQMERAPGKPTVIVGLGRTGLSVARYLAAQGEPCLVVDSREVPPGLDALRDELPGVDYRLGGFDAELFRAARQLVVSPGVALDEPAVAAAQAAGVPVLGDIELFARAACAPVVAITGSNGKSTVTTLVGEMAAAAGLAVRVGGNLGTPALELLDEQADLYVLELSSFQLEATESLNAAAAVVLNVSDDHLDRHGSIAHYAAIKQRVYRGNGVVILNADDPRVAAMAEPGRSQLRFGLRADSVDFGIVVTEGDWALLAHGEPVLRAAEMRVAGLHNLANALAALALGEAVGLPLEAMLETLRRFEGLPHRCQWVGERGGVGFYNDSKGTNVGATLAALTGMPGDKVVLIAGGLGKGADFGPLRPAVAEHARAVVLIGQDAPMIEAALAGSGVPIVHAVDMPGAVQAAATAARPGDVVLLSPACASFDMFSGYADRGNRFVDAVEGLPG